MSGQPDRHVLLYSWGPETQLVQIWDLAGHLGTTELLVAQSVKLAAFTCSAPGPSLLAAFKHHHVAGTASGAQEGRNTWATLAAQSCQLSSARPGVEDSSLPAQPLQQEVHCVSPRVQQQPPDLFAAFAAATRQSNASNAQGILGPGQSRAPAGSHAAYSSTLRGSVPQHQAGESDCRLPHHGEASFAFHPVNEPMPSQRPHHAHASPIPLSNPAIAGQLRSEAARPLPASFHRTGMWAAQEQRLPGQPAAAARSYPTPMQQHIGAQHVSTVRHPGQPMPQMYNTKAAPRATDPRATAANPMGGAEHTGQPQPSASAYRGQHQPSAHEAPRGFYDTVVQSLSANLPAASQAWLGGPAHRGLTPAPAPQEPSRAQAPTMPTTARSGAQSIQCAEPRPHSVVDTAARSCAAERGQRPGQPGDLWSNHH